MTEAAPNTRLEAFSDGVFAIAITLLVLDLKVPDLGEGQVTAARLAAALLRQWPDYLAFLISFLTILIGWVNHHTIFRQLRGSTQPLLFANGLLLLTITAIPFPTALISRYGLTSAASVAALVYCALMLLLSFAFQLVWSTARRGGLLSAGAPDNVALARQRFLAGHLGYGLALLLAFPFPLLGLGVCLGMALFYTTLGAAEQRRRITGP